MPSLDQTLRLGALARARGPKSTIRMDAVPVGAARSNHATLPAAPCRSNPTRLCSARRAPQRPPPRRQGSCSRCPRRAMRYSQRMKKAAARNAFYAQSGGVSAVINASACGVIETARKRSRHIGKVYAGRDGIIGALTEDLIDRRPREPGDHPRPQAHAGRCLRLGALQAQGPGAEPRRVRAPDRGVPRPRHRLFLLQRRQRLHGHRAEGVADRRSAGLSDHLRRRAQDRRQRPAAHRLLSGLRLGGQVHRGLHARGGARCGLDGAHLDQGVRARSDGTACRLDRRRRRPRRPQGPATPPHIILFPEIAVRRRRRFSSACKQCVDQLRLLRHRGVRGRRVCRTASSSPTPAPRMPSATRSSAASRPVVANMVREAHGYKYHWAVADYLQRAARHIASQGRRRAGLRRRQGRGRARRHGHERRDADDRAPLLQALPLGDRPVPLAEVANEEKKLPRDFITRGRLRHHRRLPPLSRAADRRRSLPALPQRPAGLRAHQGRRACAASSSTEFKV